MTSGPKRERAEVPPRERLTRDRVVRAALEIMDQEGLEAVTMRRVAKVVGVEAMSLYNHVKDKEDLLDGICSCVMRDFSVPEDLSDLMTSARGVADEWRRILKAHPNVIALFAERHRPFSDPEALRPMEIALSSIKRLGLNDRDAVKAFNAFGGYIMGFVMMETGQMFGRGPAPEELAVFASGELPTLEAALPIMLECDPDEQFEFGLDLLLAGLQARLAAH